MELQLRYHPNEQQEGDIAAWTAHVRDVVRRFGPNRRVIAIQVTNEVNLPFSPDSSDGSYEGGARRADPGRDRGEGRGAQARPSTSSRSASTGPTASTPQDDARVLELPARPRRPGVRRRRSTGSGSTPTPARSSRPPRRRASERDGMVNAMSALRCFTQGAGIPDSKPDPRGGERLPHRARRARTEARQVAGGGDAWCARSTTTAATTT